MRDMLHIDLQRDDPRRLNDIAGKAAYRVDHRSSIFLFIAAIKPVIANKLFLHRSTCNVAFIRCDSFLYVTRGA